jgi:hypothetical protein
MHDMPFDLKDFDTFVNNSLEEIGEYLFSRPREIFKRKNVKNELSIELKKVKKYFKDKKNFRNTEYSPKRMKKVVQEKPYVRYLTFQ